jgi:hypothetical protein
VRVLEDAKASVSRRGWGWGGEDIRDAFPLIELARMHGIQSFLCVKFHHGRNVLEVRRKSVSPNAFFVLSKYALPHLICTIGV